ncbi:sulfatase family protein [Flexithrix dorotheae]|uniref:sulfatase family protein n=1 Tax=Flexithrix dorotheae TaxID=70993 RepID=UPI001FDF03A7|nr:arylsulfatase [Flexithrix dorotheae]
MMKMKMLPFLLLFFTLFSCKDEKETTQQNTPKPNIIFILADDLGYGDVSALNKDSKIPTPNMDQLANEGMVFTDAHSNSSVCTPTRYGVLTGEYAWRSRIKQGVLLGYSPSLIEEDQETIAKYLKKSGYKTACIGKWHLGIDWKLKNGNYHEGKKGELFTRQLVAFKDADAIAFSEEAKGGPKRAGFDYSYILPASLDFQPYCYLENNVTVEAPTDSTAGNDMDTGYTGAFWRPGRKAPSFEFDQVLPTFTQKAVDFIDENKKGENPFFLYLPLNAPHTPWVPTESFNGKSQAGQYGDFVNMVDDVVGQILAKVKEAGLEENTMIVFTSDNGAYWKPEFIEEFDHRSNYNFRGMKADIYDGGHHIPFMVKYPGKVKAGSKSAQTICLTDFFATCQDLLNNTNSRPRDSFSLWPILNGKSTSIDRAPVVHHSGGGKFAIRDGVWKMIEGMGSGGFTEPVFPPYNPDDPKGQLYNLQEDIAETNNLYNDHPEIVSDLESKLNQLKTQ